MKRVRSVKTRAEIAVELRSRQVVDFKARAAHDQPEV
jgi:hypothetical protein